MSAILAAFETINQFLANKFQSLFSILMLVMIVGFTVSRWDKFNGRLEHVESDVSTIKNVDLPKIRSDIYDLNINVVRIEVKVDHLEEEIKEMRADIKTLLKKTP